MLPLIILNVWFKYKNMQESHTVPGESLNCLEFRSIYDFLKEKHTIMNIL